VSGREPRRIAPAGKRKGWRAPDRPLPPWLLFGAERASDVLARAMSDAACAVLIFLPVCAFTSLMNAPTKPHAPSF
jgi:hypothetical protein